MVTPYFSSIRETLLSAFKGANSSIDIAVAWFTNEQLFDTVLSRLEEGVKVRLVMINDDINHCSGLNLQRFIDKGGELYFGKTGLLMHNKYCIIDGETVLTGSYNYTYYAERSNSENIVCISDEEAAVSQYTSNYELILSLSDLARNIDSFLLEHPYTVNSYASTRLINRDLYQKALELYDEDRADQAREVMKKLETAESFIIRDVLFKQWQPRLCIERIEVTPEEVFFDINVEAISNACYVYGPGLDKTWHIVQEDGTLIYASAITDIKIDGISYVKEADIRTTYTFMTEGVYVVMDKKDRAHPLEPNAKKAYKQYVKPKDTKNLTCRLCFPKGEYVNGLFDLYEGIEKDRNSESYWHFLKVNMSLNREDSV